ncbi:MAG: hypothetical protein V2A73_21065 [Pseudomonadota bacterium]
MDFRSSTTLRKWTVVPAGRAGTRLLVAIAASIAPGRIAHLVGPRLVEIFDRSAALLRTDFCCLRQGRDQGTAGFIEGHRHLCDGVWKQREGAGGRAPTSTPLGNLVVAYGRNPRPAVEHSFDFSDTEYPYRRISSLLDPSSRLTDPVAFLERISAKVHSVGASRQRHFLERLCRALADLVEPAAPAAGRARTLVPELLHPSQWTSRGFPFDRGWESLCAWERRATSVVVDIARHAFDAFPRCESPFQQSAVILLDRPDCYCASHRLRRFLFALDTLLPYGQFVMTLGNASKQENPRSLLEAHLSGPVTEQVRPPPCHPVRILPRRACIPRGSVALIQVDGTLPNFALMQLSRHLKASGHRVELCLGGQGAEQAGVAYASCVFNLPSSLRRVDLLKKQHGARLVLGGSGVDLKLRLGAEVEALAPDYSIYPALDDRAIGFLTRGCPGRCPFCVVPVKEGSTRQVADLDMLLQGSQRKKLILLDDNLLAFPRATDLLEQMVRRRLAVNFNQTLDLRRMTAEHAELLRRLHCSNLVFQRRVYHFSLNDCRGLDALRRRYQLLRVTPADHVEFVCMYGYNSSLAEDLERLTFLRSLPRAYVFMQRYRPIPGGPAPDLSRLFDDRADQYLDALVRVVFKENMKNVERYYRFLCVEYARQRGSIHLGIVDTLFRYNHRHQRGAFLEQLRSISSRGADVEGQSDDDGPAPDIAVGR